MVPTTLWFWLIFYIHVWHGICFPWQSEFEATSSKADVYPRPRLDTWRTALPSGSVRLSISVGILLEFCWWFWLVILIDSPISPFPRDFDGFPKISRRSPEVGHAVFPDGTQIKQRALLVEFGDCALKVWVYKFIWVITCYNVFINPL
jgi:hypothetical protein